MRLKTIYCVRIESNITRSIFTSSEATIILMYIFLKRKLLQ